MGLGFREGLVELRAVVEVQHLPAEEVERPINVRGAVMFRFFSLLNLRGSCTCSDKLRSDLREVNKFLNQVRERLHLLGEERELFSLLVFSYLDEFFVLFLCEERTIVRV